MHLKMSSAKWRLFGLGLNELKLGKSTLYMQWRHLYSLPASTYTESVDFFLLLHQNSYLLLDNVIIKKRKRKLISTICECDQAENISTAVMAVASLKADALADWGMSTKVKSSSKLQGSWHSLYVTPLGSRFSPVNARTANMIHGISIFGFYSLCFLNHILGT